jgi:outer membrane protein assembly factor BamB
MRSIFSRGVFFGLPCLGAAMLFLLLMGGAVPALASDVLTYHNDVSRTGQNLDETILTTSNVNSTDFGLLFTLKVDSTIDAQPLYVSGLTISGVSHNVIYAVTENDSVYAFDADTGAQLWKVTALLAGEAAPSGKNIGCSQIGPTLGITATPVIDRSRGPNGTIYVVAMSEDKSGNYYQRLHALNLTNGVEEFGGPATVQAQYPGDGEGSQDGSVIFDAEQYAERAGLLLLNGVVYTSWTSHCDIQPYTGWIMGYSGSTLAQTSVLNVTPNGSEGSIWMSGAAPASDGTHIFLLDANGTFDTTLNAQGFPSLGDFGNAFLKISPTPGLAVADYFAMDNTVVQSEKDRDFGSGGVLLLPPQANSNGVTFNLAVGAGKDGNVYVVNQRNLGKFNATSNKIYQELRGVLGSGMWAMPAYFNGNVYFGPQLGSLKQFTFSSAKLSTTAASVTSISYEYPGTIPSISANGTANGIVWAIEHTSPSILHAYDATDLATELYNSNQAVNSRDHFGKASHFGVPTINNGKVYVGTTNSVVVFGLLGNK